MTFDASAPSINGPSNDGLFRCDKCPDKIFTKRGGFNRHYKTHSRPYRCKHCDKGFALRTDLDRHNTKHQNFLVRFPCSVPGCAFKGSSRKDNLRRHMKLCHASGSAMASGRGLKEEDIKAFCIQAQLDRTRLMECSNLLLAAELGNELILRFLIVSGNDLATRSVEGKTALHLAARRGNEECVQLLLDTGASVEIKDARDNSVLHDATYSGQPTIMERLLQKKVGLSSQNKDGLNALHLSALEGHTAVIQILLQHGADINSNSYKSGETALHLAVSKEHEDVVTLLLSQGADRKATTFDGRTVLDVAAKTGNFTLIQLFLEGSDPGTWNPGQILILAAGNCSEKTALLLLEAAGNLNATNEQREKALHWASVNGNEPVVRLLLQHEADIKSLDVACTLRKTIKSGHESIVRLLLKHGADPNAREWLKTFPLSCAAKSGHESIVQLLLKHGANVNTRNPDGTTALFWAINSGRESILQLLLQHKAVLNLEADFQGVKIPNAIEKSTEGSMRLLVDYHLDCNAFRNVFLELAAASGHENIVRLLLGRGADAGAPGKIYGSAIYAAMIGGHQTIVHLLQESLSEPSKHQPTGIALVKAAREGNEEVLRFLLRLGADANAMSGELLISATKAGHEHVVRLLLEHGAAVDKKPMWGEETALVHAVERGDNNTVQLLLQHGANVSKYSWPDTPLEKAAKTGHEHILKLLLERGASLNVGSPLRKAAANGHEPMVRLLLKHGADVNQKEEFCQTALYSAILNGHERVARLLLEHGADVNLKLRKSKSVLQRAAEHGNETLVRLLLEHGADTSNLGLGAELFIKSLSIPI